MHGDDARQWNAQEFKKLAVAMALTDGPASCVIMTLATAMETNCTLELAQHCHAFCLQRITESSDNLAEMLRKGEYN